jgi:hypothetical protein
MKVAFFSEIGSNGKYPRDFPNARTEVAWCIALDAPMMHLDNFRGHGPFDLGIVIIPKTNPNIDINKYRDLCTNVAVMQEGPHWYFQDYTIQEQFHYHNTLMAADWVYCHNTSDVSYFEGLGCVDVRVMQSLMIPEGISPRNVNIRQTIIGGNFTSWYSGFDSYAVATSIDNPIFAPSMGRKQPDEDLIENITYLPYQTWRDWMHTLGSFKIGVHLMRTHAAGTFAMNCAFHGIPCIGYHGLDTQDRLHPLTTVDVGDLKSARNIIHKLNEDDGFYDACSELSKTNFNLYYSEENWLQNWRTVNELD